MIGWPPSTKVPTHPYHAPVGLAMHATQVRHIRFPLVVIGFDFRSLPFFSHDATSTSSVYLTLSGLRLILESRPWRPISLILPFSRKQPGLRGVRYAARVLVQLVRTTEACVASIVRYTRDTSSSVHGPRSFSSVCLFVPISDLRNFLVNLDLSEHVGA